MIDRMIFKMLDCKIGMGTSLVFQPYIMALILSKTGDFRGRLETRHKIY
jgi:hypothetical protein